MPTKTRILKQYLGESFPELIKETNEYLVPLGLHIYKFGDEYCLQFDLSKLDRSAKGKLLYLLMTTPIDHNKGDEEPWEFSELSDNEKASIMAALACARKFQSDSFSIDSIKEILMPQEDKSLMTLGQFNYTISSLKRKHYLKRGPSPDTLSIGWRLHVELALIESAEPDGFNDILESLKNL